MALVNEHLLKLPIDFFFSTTEKKINTFKVTHPKAHIIRLDSGDVCLPLSHAVTQAMQLATEEMTTPNGFKGYGPKRGYDFLIDAILKNDYHPRGIQLDKSEIFISEGVQSSIVHVGNLLRHDNSIGITDPTYPIYAAANIIYGRAGTLSNSGIWSNVTYITCSPENNFLPQIPDKRIDIIYLCNPHIPTGYTFSKQELKKWIAYAQNNDALIMFDASYEAYIQHLEFPHSIYEIKGAKKVAIEYRSFSMNAGFTGVRCGYVTIPKEIEASTLSGKKIPLNQLWNQYQHIQYNGNSYITQKGAEATYSTEGKREIKTQILYYLHNARQIKSELQKTGFTVYGGEQTPFIWVKTPHGLSDWQFFDKLLYENQIAVTPGSIYGPSGKDYVRISGFCKKEDYQTTLERISTLYI